MINTDLENASKVMIGSQEAEAIYIGSNLIWNSVPYDAEIEYLESTGIQWIDTRYKHNTGLTKYKTSITLTNISSQYNSLFGARITSEGREAYYIGVQKNGIFYSCIGGNKGNSIGNLLVNTKYDIESNPSSGWIINNTSYNLPSNYSEQSVYNCYLYSLNQSDTNIENACMKVYYFQIYEGNDLVLDLIPVRIGQTGYMYDKVSKQLFGNSGTGDFVLGPDKNLSYYISGGLIFHLDGINKGNTTNNIIWEDLINQVQFVKNDINANNIEITNNSIKFTRQQSYYLESNDSSKEPSIEDLNNGDYTIECCIYPLTYNSGFIFGGGRAQNSKYPLCYIEDGKRITWSQGRAVYILPDNTLSQNNKYTFSISNNSFIINGQDYTSYKANKTDYWDSNNNRFIIGAATGGGASQYGFNGYLYSIRIYNRILTKEEQIYNQKIDNNRFELGLSI